MQVRRRSVLKLISASAAGLATSGLRAFADGCPVIERDVCVLGGGSSGTYSAIRLRDAGKSVVVLERKPRLGGHTETFRDPATGGVIDYGVEIFHDLPAVRDYFARLGVTPAPAPSFGGFGVNVDFRTGAIAQFTPPPQAEVQQALGTYFGLLQQLRATYYDLDSGFDLPQPVPADLLLPFGDFVVKFGLQAMVPTAFIFGQGLGDILRMPTVYVAKNSSVQLLTSIFSGGFLHAPAGNGELYDRATGILEGDIIFRATIAHAERHRRGVTLRVRTDHAQYEIRCKQLLVTCPPTLDNLRVLELDAFESATLGRLRSNFFWTAIVRLSGMPAGLSVSNRGQDTLYNLPALPGIYGMSPTEVPGLWNLKYGSATWLPDAEVRRRITLDIQRLHDKTTFPSPPRVEEFIVFSPHNPFELYVPAEDIAGGFYTALGSLQGRNHTFYNGAAFHTHDSSLLWRFSRDHVLPLMLA